MLYYYEQDSMGENYAISSGTIDPNNYVSTRVPSPALVDIDSTVKIKVRAQPDKTSRFSDKPMKELLDRKNKLIVLMTSLDELMTLNTETLGAYAIEPDGEETDQLIQELAVKTGDFITAFMSLFPRDSDAYATATALVGSGGGLGALAPFLQMEIDEIDQANKEIQKAAQKRSSTLRINAFVDRPTEKELSAIHVKGYDSLPEQKTVARDRSGITLSEEERVKLQKQIKATEDLARTLESVRAKEITLHEGLNEILGQVAPDLAEQVEKAEELAKKITDSERLKMVHESFDTAIAKVKQDGHNFTDEQLTKLEQLPSMLINSLAKDVKGVEATLKIITDAEQLTKAWKNVGSVQDLNSMAILAMDSKQLWNDIIYAYYELPQWLQTAADSTDLFLNQEVEGVELAAVEQLQDLIESEELQAVADDIKSYYEDIQASIEVINEIAGILQITQIDSTKVAPSIPESFDVDLENLQDTSINLKKVELQAGDTILVKATLKEPGRKPVESTAEFKITHYGWHARLSPSVVLVRPDQLASGNTEFRFAPALGWMHHYRPRPSANDFLQIVGAFQPALGMHSTFLNFDNESGIGLGGTLSFWNDRLQFGLGYNLSASSSDEGEIYYFIGSDLIGLLQAAGVNTN